MNNFRIQTFSCFKRNFGEKCESNRVDSLLSFSLSKLSLPPPLFCAGEADAMRHAAGHPCRLCRAKAAPASPRPASDMPRHRPSPPLLMPHAAAARPLRSGAAMASALPQGPPWPASGRLRAQALPSRAPAAARPAVPSSRGGARRKASMSGMGASRWLVPAAGLLRAVSGATGRGLAARWRGREPGAGRRAGRRRELRGLYPASEHRR